MESIAVLILAAGLGKRMGLDLPKALARTDEGPLIQFVIRSAAKLSPDKVVVVTGHGRELVEEEIREHASRFDYDPKLVEFAFQEEQKGTGHAVSCALPLLKDFKGTVIILYGDVPLIGEQTLKSLVKRHTKLNSTLTLISAITDRPGPYGRVVRDVSSGLVKGVIEAKDCSESELIINEINSGIYAVDSAFLAPAVDALENNNVQSEYYLTDIVGKAASEGQTVCVYTVDDIDEVQGVNTLSELHKINYLIRRRRVDDLILAGVKVKDPDSFFVEPTVKIEAGAEIGPNVQLIGATEIESGVVIEGSAYISSCKIKKASRIRFSVRLEDSVIGERASVGPFANLRPGSVLEDDVKIGNFVETKKTHLKKGAKASHLSYLGDSVIGKEANIGAGTITCNYDGYKKSETEVGDGAFIGSNTSLIAPVKIGADASVGAGSVISKDVAPGDLAFTRAPVKTIEGWSEKKKNSATTKKRS